MTLASASSAATFTPNSFDDRIDANPGDGICATSAPVVCTLRAAVMEANALAGPDIIALNGGTYTLTRPGLNENAALTGDLDLTDVAGLAILSQAGIITTIDGDARDRVLDVRAGHLVLSGVRIIKGHAQWADSALDTSVGGGIRFNPGTGGTLQFSILENNRAHAGGGIWAHSANVLLRYSQLRANHAGDTGPLETNPEGAGIRVTYGTSLRIENSSLYNHFTYQSAFGIQGTVSLEYSSLALFSSTISGDNVSAIHTWGSDVVLQNATISNNGAGLVWSSNAEVLGSHSLFIRNSVFAGNDNSDCGIFSVSPGDIHDIDGHNLDSDGTCGFAPGFGNLPNTDAKLLPLSTSLLLPAHFPAPDSPLINAGSPLNPASGNPEACFQFDQLGNQRRTGKCDIGAVEEGSELFSDGFEQP
ncbi:hypothetical protein B1808_14555 [Pseudofulvimonas gallinarii]|nr:hypothetical protein B1808_14555 [Pseudofulvimonas gallinarii]